MKSGPDGPSYARDLPQRRRFPQHRLRRQRIADLFPELARDLAQPRAADGKEAAGA
mgnify:CR=1 FL=1